MKIVKILAFGFVVVCYLVSCSNNINSTRNTGIWANDEVVSSIKQEIEDRENSLLAVDGDIFWTPSGTNWHESYKCSYLSNSKTIYHGTVEEAKLEGKEKACERCSHSE